MKSAPRALILDFGGVLTTDLWESIRSCARREGLPADRLLNLLQSDSEIHSLFVGLERGEVSQADFETKLASAAGVDSEGLLQRMCDDLRPDYAMLDAVSSLRASGVLIGILSNSWGTGYFNPYAGYDLENRADAVVLSDQVRMRKPEKAIFEHILHLLGVQADDCVFIDDVEGHLSNASAMGMTTIHHVRSDDTVLRLKKMFATGWS